MTYDHVSEALLLLHRVVHVCRNERLRLVEIIAFLALRLRTSARASTRACEGALRAGAFTTGFFIVLIKPLFVTLIHIIDKSVRESEGYGLLDSVGRLQVFVSQADT